MKEIELCDFKEQHLNMLCPYCNYSFIETLFDNIIGYGKFKSTYYSFSGNYGIGFFCPKCNKKSVRNISKIGLEEFITLMNRKKVLKNLKKTK